MTQELREKVARAIYDAGQTWLRDNPFNFPTAMPPQVLADAAIAIIRGETLEEAAQTAELDECGCCTCIAAAIRALKDKP